MSQDILKEVLKKYSLLFPIPLEVQKELHSAKKDTLKYILKNKRDYSFYVMVVLSFYYMVKNLGFDFSYKKSRIFVRTASSALALVALALTFFLVRPYFYGEPFRGAAAICVFGDAKLFHENKEKPLKARDIISAGDKITTGAKSFVIIQIDNKVLVRIQENSLVEAASVIVSGRKEFSINRGFVLSKLKKAEGDESFAVKTPTTVASVRGTAFSASITAEGTVIAVKEGTVSIEHSSGRYTASQGESIQVSNAAGKRAITDLEALEIKRITLMPYQEKTIDMTDPEVEQLLKEVLERDRLIDEEIANLKKKESGERLPQTLEEIREKYGRIDTVFLFNGKVYKGAIITRGANIKFLVPKKYIYLPAKDVQYTR